MKNYLLKILAVFVMLLLLMGGVNAQNKQVVYLYDPSKATDTNTGAHPEMTVANFILGLGGYDVHMLGTPNLLNCTQVQLDSLRNADLIVIGRGLASGNFNGHQDSIWNPITTPVLSLSMFAIRSGTLKWFDTNDPDYGGTSPSFKVKVNVPGDAVFAGLSMPNDSLEFWNGAWNSLIAGPAGSETILASFTNTTDGKLRIVYARFNYGVEFYALGAPLAWTDHIPRGYRTFMGMGADSGGGNPYNYFGFSFDGQDVLKREIERLIALGKPTGINIAKASLNANVYPNPAVSNINIEMAKLKDVNIMDITGKLVKSVKAKGQDLSVNISNLRPGVYFVKATNSNNNSVVTKIVKK